MILQALKEYYDRKVADPESGIAPEGWIQGGIDFLIELDSEGEYLGLHSLQDKEGKKTVPKSILVPNIGKQAMKHAMNGKDANLLWDNSSFVLGLGDKGDLKLESMIQAIEEWIGEGKDAGVDAVLSFLRRGLKNRKHFSALMNDREYGEELASGKPKLSFHIQGSRHKIVFDAKKVSDCLAGSTSIATGGDDLRGLCLVTGDIDALLEPTHPVIKGVWGAQTSGANLVSFNRPSFLSFNKKQSYNAPVSKKAASEYSKSLNMLLDSEQRLQIGDASTVFWSATKTNFESDFAFFFKEAERDDPDGGACRVKNLFESPKSGAYVDDQGDEKFYVLGLAPNAARLAVRFWQVGTVAEFALRIRQHFEDLSIVKPAKETQYYTISQILRNISPQEKIDKIPPAVAGDFMRSILDGSIYPQTLLQFVLRRIRVDIDEWKWPVRAALIKAYLNRCFRVQLNMKGKEIQMALDTDQPSIGYQLGRLFSALEKIQEEGNPGINATIRERYYGAACSSPVTVFGTLMRLKNHHLAKIENRGRAVNFERLVGEIVGHLDDFPPYLDLHEQGRFAIGYYHQRQDFFPKKDDKNK
jgi:CRISPR-associated protein Csd1